MTEIASSRPITGRCYCGTTRFRASEAPTTVSYCHCGDCRRVTGAPVAAFASFREEAISFSPNEGRTVSANPGVTRSFCETCGSPLTGRYDYLPGKVYVALGLIDQAGDFPPELHSHHDNCLSWLHIEDGLERHSGSARSRLKE
ncbi:GFA family protein [Nisaea acidiphila]|uniref:GFA family protein n=1 Tax=Nisaea acidiphila TaxID=1862145 RepID=A0A9J7ANR4_9PROT|nr:GFA family protein [Nisaea acidiphila]UUX48847.1 GFA family protein [Nisaea acidiphila]